MTRRRGSIAHLIRARHPQQVADLRQLSLLPHPNSERELRAVACCGLWGEGLERRVTGSLGQCYQHRGSSIRQRGHWMNAQCAMVKLIHLEICTPEEQPPIYAGAYVTIYNSTHIAKKENKQRVKTKPTGGNNKGGVQPILTAQWRV